MPAMGYSESQLRDLAATMDAVDCDTIIVGSPVDLTRLISLSRPFCRVRYDLEEINRPDLADVMSLFLHDHTQRLKPS